MEAGLLDLEPNKESQMAHVLADSGPDNQSQRMAYLSEAAEKERAPQIK